ncbi:MULTISPECIES: CRISPR-associated helicase Cas3' [Metallosphaera]|uniref:CRISPR-associated helicase Cas3 n=1 Tax=Metallosphaera prunae TaxID=47304 RepID=A0A4D8S199_METPR|nr:MULTISPECIES: CRISPR-associated helicase Cas3' [Metallosphaera]QCO29209.1 CRISPR-associated helicase Cas3' [Metallosphaera prunae]BBL47172.1 CRISPR-associated helicase Cas3 [Metallosphaera sedula]
MSSLVDYYGEACKLQGFEPRKGIEETLSKIEEGKAVILTAPTGYGKTSLTYALGLASLRGNGHFDRVIHVLPLRSIVQDLTSKLENFMRLAGYSNTVVGAYDMDFHDTPYFLRKVNVTTLDSFVLNMFKLPVSEITRGMKGMGTHYEVPRGAIYSSVVVFDEFHLFSDDGGKDKSLTSVIALLRGLGAMQVPFVIMTATLPGSLRDLIKEELEDVVEVVEVKDNFKIERDVSVDFVDELDFNKLDRRTLVVMNTRKGAITAYQEAKKAGLSPVLIHSKFSAMDRRRKVDEIKNAKLVISTQVIEAGIDVSFDVLYTEAAPLPNLVQRAGRVARYGGQGEVHILPFSGHVYDRNDVETSLEIVRREGKLDSSLMSSFNTSYILNSDLLFSLNILDEGPFFSSEATAKLLKKECSITRETSLIMGFPQGCRSSACGIPLTEDEAKDLLERGAKPLRDGELVDWKPGNLCLSIDFMLKGIDGISVDYNQEVGAIL